MTRRMHMKKLFLVILLFTLTLSACGGVKSSVPNDPYAKESQAIVEKWIAAFHNLDAQALLSLYSNDVTFWDCGLNINCDVGRLVDLQGVVPLAFKEQGFNVEAQSYMVTGFGRFAVLQVMYADPMGGQKTSTPATVILEFKDGKILNETWYYILE
jgi:ketosteroid isomerase-like protein